VQASVRLASPIGSVVLRTVLLAAAACVGTALAGITPTAPAVVAIAALALTIGVGVCLPSSGVFARPVIRARTGRRELALTFDDGPDPRWTPPLLEMLAARGQRATFFVVGERAERHAGLLSEMASRGHEIANHTWAHSLGTMFVAPRRLARDLERVNSLVERSTGVRPRWFRAPVGLLSPRIPIAAQLAKLRLVSWTASARDGVRSATVAGAFGRLDKAMVPGAILVLHDGTMRGDREPIARELLELLLDRMEVLGLRSVTLSELCSPGVAAPVPTDAGSDGGADDRAEQNAQRQPADRPRQ
jgi:peptidoglycan/xylan/chitin deacetylase (PgdA/CDA1 family)